MRISHPAAGRHRAQTARRAPQGLRLVAIGAVAASALVALPGQAHAASTISLGAGLKLTTTDGAAITVSVSHITKSQLLLSIGSSQTCSNSGLLGSVGSPACTTATKILPSSAAQISSGASQLTYLAFYVNGQALLQRAAATDTIELLNPYDNTVYEISGLSCSQANACGSTLSLTVANSGPLAAPIVSYAAWNTTGAVLPALQSGSSGTDVGSVSGSI